MGLPSLLEDIVQRRIDNFLEDAVDRGQFYTRDEFKRAVSRLGINARTLLNVDDDELVEISEEFAKETKRYRDENAALNRTQKEATAKADQLDQSLIAEKQRSAGLEKSLDELTAELSQANGQVRKLQRALSSLGANKAQLEASLAECQRELAELKTFVMQKLVDK